MNSLTFEMHIGDKLNTDIETYKRKLNELLVNRAINIKINGTLGDTVKNLTQQLEALTKAQKEMNTVQKNIGSGQNKPAGNGGLFDISGAEKLQNELAQHARAIDETIAKIQKSINDMGKGIDVESALQKFREGVRGMTEVLTPFQTALEKMSKFSGPFEQMAKAMSEATAQIQKSFKQAADAQNEAGGGKSIKQKVMDEVEAYMRLQNALNLVTMALRDMEMTQAQLPNSGTSAEKVANYIQELGKIKSALESATQNIGSANIEEINQLNSKLQSVIQSARSFAAEEKNATKSVNTAKIAVEDLGARIAQLNKAEDQTKGLKVDTSSLVKAREELAKLLEAMGKFAKRETPLSVNGEIFHSADELKRSSLYQNALKTATRANAEVMEQVRRANKGTAQSAGQLSQEEQRLAQAFNKTTGEARNQSQVLSGLKGLMLQYFSVYGAQQFLTSMVQVTGELELQRKSLEVILGSGSAASEMYYQLRDLSQQSPYTFEDLLKAHRQLAAFGIEAKNIYGTMKSLTDIGAGLDVPVERLILAYGHTRSYGYLSGIQNRQFETAGIDMIGGLMDLYNRRADEARKAGKAGTYVNRKDIFSRMRTRDIPFEDVEEVIMGLDQPGGKFYNMQERQYETVGGKLRNLRNNWRIMLSEIGNGSHGVIMGALNILNSLTANWDKLAVVLKGVLPVLGAVKLAMLALNQAGRQQGQRLVRNIIPALQNNANMAKGFWGGFAQGWGSMNGRSLTVTDAQADAFSNQINKRMANGTLSKTMARQLAYSRQLPPRLREIAAAASGMSKAEAKAASETTGLNRHLGLLRAQAEGAGAAVGRFASGMWAAIWNPATAAMAGLTAIFSLFAWFKKEADTVTDVGNEMRNNATRDLETISSVLDNLQNKYGKVVDTTSVEMSNQPLSTSQGGSKNTDTKVNVRTIQRAGTPAEGIEGARFYLDETQMMAEGVENIFEELDKKLQILDPLYKGDLYDVQKFDSQYAQVQEMGSKLGDLEYANKVQQDYPDLMVSANKDTHWFMTDSYGEDMKDYQKAVRKRNNKLLEIDASEIREFLKMRGENTEAILAGQERNALAEYMSIDANKDKVTTGKIDKYRVAVRNADEAREEVEAEASEIADTMANVFEEKFKNRPSAFTYYLRQQYNGLMTQFNVADPGVIEEQFAVLYKDVADKVKESGNDAVFKEFQKSFANAIMGPEVEAEIKKNLKGQKLSDLTKPELQKLVDSSVKTVRDRLIQKFPALEEVIKLLFKVGSDEATSAINSVRNATDDFAEAWKREAMDKLGSTMFADTVRSAQNVVEMFDNLKKKAKEFQSYLSTVKPYLEMKVGIKFPDFKRFKEFLDTITYSSGNNKGKKVNWDTANFSDSSITKLRNGQIVSSRVLQETYKKWRDISVTEQFFEENGQSLGDGKKSNKAQTERDKRWRKEDQTLIKNLQSRQKNLQEAYRTYWAWYDKLGQDEDAAMAKVRDKFTRAQISDEDLRNLRSQEGYIKLLNDFIKEVDKTAQKLHFKNDNKDTIDNIKVNASGVIDQTEQKQFDENTKDYTSELERQVRLLEEQYDLYKKIYELTGDADLAMRLSGRTSMVAPTKAEQLQNYIRNRANSYLDIDGNRNLSLLGGREIDFGMVAGMSDEDIKSYVGRLVNKDANGNMRSKAELDSMQPKIEGLTKNLIEWRDLEREAQRESAEAYAQIIGKSQNYADVVKRNNAALKDRIELINANKDLSKGEKLQAIDIATQETATKNLQASAGYYELMNNASGMAETYFLENYQKAIDDLNARFRTGAISAQAYVKEEARLRKIRQDYKNNGLFGKDTQTTAFLQGGFSGLSDWLNRHIESAESKIREEEKNPYRAQAKINQDEQIQGWRKLQEQIAKVADGFSDLQGVLSIVTEAIDGFAKGMQSLSEMFDALGDEDQAAEFSDIADGANAISSGIHSLIGGIQSAAQGNVGGLFSGIIGTFTGPITGFAKLHDKKRQRSIDKIMEDVSKIENSVSTIQSLRQYELGVDGSSRIVDRIRKAFGYGRTVGSTAGQIANNNYGSEGVDSAMNQYYLGLGYGNSYVQEYNKLLEEREKYVKAYDKEAGKKKSSSSALEEYRKKISDLDIQITMFSENMAKELYGIDFKGWASQLSDALVTAFENGEDAADAFHDSVTSILQSLAKNIISVGIMEPLFERLRNELFGYTDEYGKVHKGSFNIEDPNGSREAWMASINEALGTNGYVTQGVNAAEALLNVLETQANKYGSSLLSNDNGSMSSSIKGITEETADLMAAYLNAIRADVSVIRQLYGSKAVTYMESMSEIAKSQVTYQSQIAENTLRNAQAAEAIVQSNADILYLFNAIVNDTKQVYVKVK